MALGDGIRRNIALVSDEERNRYISAIIKLDTTKFFSDGVSYWDKQEDIHKNGHESGLDVHGGIEFLPWHRSLINHFEELLREVDPELSLHYWDWSTDPRVAPPGGAALFTNAFMDNSNGDVSHLLAGFTSTEPGKPKVWRSLDSGTPGIASDADLINAANFNILADNSHLGNNGAHGSAHGYIGGTISDAHYSFHDPFVFLIHCNLDRLWAKWQTDPAHPERLTVAGAYSGVSASDANKLANDYVNPWAGETGLAPWSTDPTKTDLSKYTDLSIIIPRCYDTNLSTYRAAEAENPLNAGTNRFIVNFNSVPEEETTWRAAVIQVYSCEDATFRVKAGTEPALPFAIVFPPHGDALADHDPNATHPYAEARIWFSFTAGAVGTAPQNIGPVNTTIECVENPAISFNFELTADTIKRKTVAIQLVLDQSGSMNDPAGSSGLSRLDVLKDSATLFVNLIPKNNAVGIIRFDDDAYPPTHPTYGGYVMTKIPTDLFTDPKRNDARTAISLHGAHGHTSVGDGIQMGVDQLNAIPDADYDEEAMIVFTDGLQNRDVSIESVMPLVNNRTFAIGLGTETQVNTLELNNVTNGSGGYLLLSGLSTTSIDDQYRMMKFFMQIMANVTNTQIVKDPNGYLSSGTKLKIPFSLCEADIHARVILLNEFPVINLSVEMPDGQIINTGNAASYNAKFENNYKDTVICDFSLPVLKAATTNHGGTWYAVIEIDEEAYKRYLHSKENQQSSLKTKGARYSVSIHSYSNLKMTARLDQTGLEPGAKMNLRALLTEYNIPLSHHAEVIAHVERPDHSKTILHFAETEPGVHEASMHALMSGIYHFQLIATGVNYKGVPFTREHIFTGSVFQGGNTPVRVSDPGTGVVNTNLSKDDNCCRNMTRIGWVIVVLLILILIALLIGLRN